jgi:hypothetical protein
MTPTFGLPATEDRPDDASPQVSGDTDNARRRNGTPGMQPSLSPVMVTPWLTDFLAPNVGGS